MAKKLPRYLKSFMKSQTIKLLKLPCFFCSFIVHTIAHCFVSKCIAQMKILFQLQYLFLCTFLPYFIIKLYHEMHIIYAKFGGSNRHFFKHPHYFFNLPLSNQPTNTIIVYADCDCDWITKKSD